MKMLLFKHFVGIHKKSSLYELDDYQVKSILQLIALSKGTHEIYGLGGIHMCKSKEIDELFHIH